MFIVQSSLVVNVVYYPGVTVEVAPSRAISITLCSVSISAHSDESNGAKYKALPDALIFMTVSELLMRRPDGGHSDVQKFQRGFGSFVSLYLAEKYA